VNGVVVGLALKVQEAVAVVEIGGDASGVMSDPSVLQAAP
jgi:hypothetical protein